MAQFLSIHPDNPQGRLLETVGEILRNGGLIVYPTDSCYALGCQVGDKAATDRIRRIRATGKDHNFTLVCRDLSELAIYANVDNSAYRLLRALTPGPYTFILRATSEVPKRLQHPKRRTIGLRVPDNAIAQGILEALDAPIMSSTLVFPGEDLPMTDATEIRERLEREVDAVVDGGSCGFEPTTVLDLTGGEIVVRRKGKGEIAFLEE
ncbi:MAG: L-threonylcarbamoyladenylate synthase [Gammaproteobacteria bacterium]|nr:L-threonylcarbamoyladenylate synthase [Gammaproteobacteria bacterium]MDH3508169.1 L-threonylcarbamoyladenylate synthase [Gammaproteobacteria bacterium]